MKKSVLHSKIIITRQLKNIFDYIIRYLGNKGNNELLIQKRLYSKLEETLKQISFAYHEIILDKISSLIRDIYRENLTGLFVKAKKELKLARI